MKLANTNWVVGFVCLAVGGASMHIIENFTLAPKLAQRQQISIAKPVDSPFDRSPDPFKEMQKMREFMLSQFNPQAGGSLFGDSNAPGISQREDEKYLYYDVAVEGLKPEKVKVKVQDGQLSISGQVEKKAADGRSSSYLVSTFHRSFPVPPNVDANRAQIDQEKETLVVKFPKTGKANV